jgi:hypothetical protein
MGKAPRRTTALADTAITPRLLRRSSRHGRCERNVVVNRQEQQVPSTLERDLVTKSA